MEQIIAEYASLSHGEMVFVIVTGIYMIVTTIWGLRIIYREKKESWLEEKKENRTLMKLLKFWGTAVAFMTLQIVMNGFVFSDWESCCMELGQIESYSMKRVKLHARAGNGEYHGKIHSRFHVPKLWGEGFFVSYDHLYGCYDNLGIKDNLPRKEEKLAGRGEGKSDIDETPEILVNGSRIFQIADCHEMIRSLVLEVKLNGVEWSWIELSLIQGNGTSCVLVLAMESIMEQIIAEYASLSHGEMVFVIVTGIYMIVTTIWGLRIIYREKKESWLEEKKENRTLMKLLIFWGTAVAFTNMQIVMNGFVFSDWESCGMELGQNESYPMKWNKLHTRAGKGGHHGTAHSGVHVPKP